MPQLACLCHAAVPGGREHQRKDAEGFLGQMLEDGQRKGCRLAAASVRRAYDIPASQHRWDAASLHLYMSAARHHLAKPPRGFMPSSSTAEHSSKIPLPCLAEGALPAGNTPYHGSGHSQLT